MLPYIFEFFFAQRVGKTVVSRFHRKRGELQLFNAPILIAARAPRCVPQRVPRRLRKRNRQLFIAYARRQRLIIIPIYLPALCMIAERIIGTDFLRKGFQGARLRL